MPGQVAATSVMLMGRLSQSPEDREAWERFVFLYGPQIVEWCRHHGLQADDARDVAQEVLLQFLKQIGRFRYDPSKSFRGYLRTMTHAAWCDWVERRHGARDGRGGSGLLRLLEQMPARDELYARLEEEYDRELLEIAMERVRDRVEPHTWEAFRLLALENLPGKAVAERLGMKIGAAITARSKVQKMLRETIEELDPHE